MSIVPFRPTASCLIRPLACLLTGFALCFATAVQADTLRRGLGPEPDSLHIHRAQGLAAVNLLRDLREGLVTFDVNGEPAPGVASNWEQFEGGLRYRFSLRPDAHWSDGSAVSADDFVRAWSLALSPATAAVNAALLKDVLNAGSVLKGELPAAELGIRALDPQTLEVRLQRPVPWLLELLAHPVSYPLHAEDAENSRDAPINGAYQIDEWQPRSAIRLKANPHFHSANDVHFQQVEYFPIEEASTELARYRAGELDITETIPAGRFAWLQENLPNDLRISPYLGSFWLGLNMQDPVLGGSAELRRALALAIDRATLVRVVLGAGELPAFGAVPPGMNGYQPQSMAMADASQTEREAEAKRLMQVVGREAGIGVKKPLLQLRYNTSGVHRRVAIAVAAMWKQVLGLNTELINEEWKVFVNNRRLGIVTQVFRGGWIADYADPTSFLEQFQNDSELNVTFSNDQEFDQLMAGASLMSGPGRMRELQQAEGRLLQFLPVIPLYHYVSRHLVKPGIGNYADNIRDIHLSRYLRVENNEESW
ncbi:MAG: peptide ABC transporter substrate-binding protein [Xanthomonadales bacterium]|nr:peptide ABC transporter substrate-binding protein [Xanthomonadales bacterium]